MHYSKIIKLCFLLILVNFCGCAKKSTSPKIDLKNYPIFLEMTKNLTVFENLGPVLYKSLYEQFMRSGYFLVSGKKDGYILKTKIESLNDGSARFISLDVVPYFFRVELVIKCQLYNSSGKILVDKDFKYSKWFSRPKDALLDTNFLTYQYEDMLRRSVIKIDQFFKLFFIKHQINGFEISSCKI